MQSRNEDDFIAGTQRSINTSQQLPIGLIHKNKDSGSTKYAIIGLEDQRCSLKSKNSEKKTKEKKRTQCHPERRVQGVRRHTER